MPADQTDLLAQIRSAQSDLDQMLAQLGSDAGSALADGQAQRQLLGQLERSLVSGSSLAVITARGEIAAAVSTTSNLVQQARLASEQRGAELATVQARTRAAVEQIGRDIFERRIFDPYLRFTSADEEAAYREREAQRRDYISRELERGTPEGNLSATNATIDQIRDAGAYGAERSPEYARMIRDAEQMRREQLATMRSTEISPSPPNAMPPAQANAPSANLDEIAAVFRSAGVTSPSAGSADQASHGLSGFGLDRSSGGPARLG